MTHVLDGIHAKIERAEQHIEKLNAEISDFCSCNPNPYHVVGQLQPNEMDYVFTASGELVVPLHFSVIAGEIIHHLRSSFDHLVHALIINNSKTPANNNQFPVCAKPEQFKQACNDGRIKGVSQTARKIIQSVQPYTTKSAVTSTLKFIHDLDVLDKHRLLVVTAGAITLADLTTLTLGSHDTSSDEPIEFANFIINDSLPKVTDGGVEVARVRLAKPCPGFHAETQFVPLIVIETPAGNQPVGQTLTKMSKYTTKTIDNFKSQF